MGTMEQDAGGVKADFGSASTQRREFMRLDV
jgi:hypothetical protein